MSTVSALPAFSEFGVLPPGDYGLTFEALRQCFLAVERADNRYWDHTWRARLVDNLEVLTGQLRAVGISKIFVNGSFVEDKDHPHDIDGYFECDPDYLMSGRYKKTLIFKILTRYGLGIPRNGCPRPALQKTNCRCGTGTEWSCIRTVLA